jgi:hypothetical protein
VAPNDYVIVHPFYCGVTFNRYYKGAAPWTTLPPLEDYTLQRWDLFMAKMQTKDPIAPVIERITSTLQSGNRVWLVGNFPFDKRPLEEIRPAPNDPLGGSEGRYSFYWGVQVTQFLSAHSQSKVLVMAPSTMSAFDYSGPLYGAEKLPNNCVNQFENLPVFMMSEWKP